MPINPFEEEFKKIVQKHSLGLYKAAFGELTGDLSKLLDKTILRIEHGFLKCQNNDCKCREGFGLCGQCRDGAEELLKEFKELLEILRSNNECIQEEECKD